MSGGKKGKIEPSGIIDANEGGAPRGEKAKKRYGHGKPSGGLTQVRKDYKKWGSHIQRKSRCRRFYGKKATRTSQRKTKQGGWVGQSIQRRSVRRGPTRTSQNLYISIVREKGRPKNEKKKKKLKARSDTWKI